MGPVILTIVISFWISTVKGSCPGSYYHCTGYSWCCPRGYSCTGTSRCYESSSSSSSGGAIAGGIVGGIILVIIICCISATIKSKTGKVSRVIYPKRRTTREATVPKKQQPSSSSKPVTRQNEMTLPGSYEPFNPPLSHHI
ncbi:uncharacterized protein LOC127737260 isoform X3 [Mytilus californianus]|uniref:uncharacterized protein LOC127737260 isoform X3 n=1 Tax=Mytilus californianus TaxID=6549 RepID=UPI0022463510|nr:uncharacterized protein LOC127737260 isoform X3 [Mytilus californianus]